MSLYAFAVPVQTGKMDNAREFAAEIGRRTDAKAAYERAGIDRVRAYHQELPQGDVMVVVWDTDDGMRARTELLSASDEFGTWFREQLAEYGGPASVDVTNLPAPELLGEWSGDDYDPAGGDWSFLVPIADGRIDGYRSMVDEMFRGSQHDAFVETRALLGVTRQTMFLFETPMGPFALPVIEGPGASKVFGEQLRRDDHPFFTWWRDQVRSVTGRIQTGPPKVEKLLDLVVTQRVTTNR